MLIDYEIQNSAIHIRLNGALDIYSVSEVWAALAQQTEPYHLDLSHIHFADSAALQLLLYLSRQTPCVTFKQPSANLIALASLLGLSQLFVEGD